MHYSDLIPFKPFKKPHVDSINELLVTFGIDLTALQRSITRPILGWQAFTITPVWVFFQIGARAEPI